MDSIRKMRTVNIVLVASIVCITAVFALALAGCSGSSSTTSSSSTSSSSTSSSASSSASATVATGDAYRTLDQIKSDGTIKIGVYGDGGVQQKFDEAIAARMAKDLDVQVETVPLGTDECITAVQTGAVDLLVANLTATEERAAQVDFATDYAFASTGILTSDGNAISSEEQIADGRKIGVLKGTTAETLLESRYPGIQLVEIDSYDALIDGTVDAIADDKALLLVWEAGYPGYSICVVYPSSEQDIAPAVAKGNSSLLAAVNSEVDMLNKAQFFSETFNSIVLPAVDNDQLSPRTCLRDSHIDDTAVADFDLVDGSYNSSDGAITMVVEDGKPNIVFISNPALTADQAGADYNEITAKASK